MFIASLSLVLQLQKCWFSKRLQLPFVHSRGLLRMEQHWKRMEVMWFEYDWKCLKCFATHPQSRVQCKQWMLCLQGIELNWSVCQCLWQSMYAYPQFKMSRYTHVERAFSFLFVLNVLSMLFYSNTIVQLLHHWRDLPETFLAYQMCWFSSILKCPIKSVWYWRTILK